MISVQEERLNHPWAKNMQLVGTCLWPIDNPELALKICNGSYDIALKEFKEYVIKYVDLKNPTVDTGMGIEDNLEWIAYQASGYSDEVEVLFEEIFSDSEIEDIEFIQKMKSVSVEELLRIE